MTEIDLSRATWRKSRYSQQNGECVEVAGNLPSAVAIRDSKWRTSSYSNNGGECVEVAPLPDLVGVRDSKDVERRRVLVLPPRAWGELLRRVEVDELP